MFKTSWLTFVCITLCATLAECDLKSRFHRNHTSGEAATTPTPAPYIITNTLPKLEPGCLFHFYCKLKLTHAEPPKPCLVMCVSRVMCNGKIQSGRNKDQCLNYNEELVKKEYNECKPDERNDGRQDADSVAMIDFPCQPGYLPDSRGRCREVW